jgi:hypothetical protein
MSISLRGADLRGFDLSGANLRDCDFHGAQLDGARFAGAHLECGFTGLETLPIGAIFQDLDVGPEMVVVPAGEFTMGSNEHSDEGASHVVTIKASFAVGRFAVTFAEWDAAGLAHKPNDQGRGRGRQPVFDVSWAEAEAYVSWLSQRTGKTYRLLSDAEWEYCCRAGTTTQHDFGDQIVASRAQLQARQTAEVGTFAPNAWGLYDMHGNVWEWCADNWHDDHKGAPQDGSVGGAVTCLCAFCVGVPGASSQALSNRLTASSSSRTAATAMSASELPGRSNILPLCRRPICARPTPGRGAQPLRSVPGPSAATKEIGGLTTQERLRAPFRRVIDVLGCSGRIAE